MPYFRCLVRLNANNFLLLSCSFQPAFYQQVEQMDPRRTALKHTDYYLCSENNVSTPFLAVLDGSKFLEITFLYVEVKKDF